MEKHVTVLAALLLGLGFLGVIGMLVVMAIFGLGSGILVEVSAQEPDIPEFVTWLPAAFGLIISAIIAITTIPCLVAGYGLLQRRHWSKVAGLLAGVLNVVFFPVGTAVAIYSVWLFLQDETDQYFSN